MPFLARKTSRFSRDTWHAQAASEDFLGRAFKDRAYTTSFWLPDASIALVAVAFLGQGVTDFLERSGPWTEVAVLGALGLGPGALLAFGVCGLDTEAQPLRRRWCTVVGLALLVMGLLWDATRRWILFKPPFAGGGALVPGECWYLLWSSLRMALSSAAMGAAAAVLGLLFQRAARCLRGCSSGPRKAASLPLLQEAADAEGAPVELPLEDGGLPVPGRLQEDLFAPVAAPYASPDLVLLGILVYLALPFSLPFGGRELICHAWELHYVAKLGRRHGRPGYKCCRSFLKDFVVDFSRAWGFVLASCFPLLAWLGLISRFCNAKDQMDAAPWLMLIPLFLAVSSAVAASIGSALECHALYSLQWGGQATERRLQLLRELEGLDPGLWTDSRGNDLREKSRRLVLAPRLSNKYHDALAEAHAGHLSKDGGGLPPVAVAQELLRGFYPPARRTCILVASEYLGTFVSDVLWPTARSLVLGGLVVLPSFFAWHDNEWQVALAHLPETGRGRFAYGLYVVTLCTPRSGVPLLLDAMQIVRDDLRRRCNAMNALRRMIAGKPAANRSLLPAVNLARRRDMVTWMLLFDLIARHRSQYRTVGEVCIGLTLFYVTLAFAFRAAVNESMFSLGVGSHLMLLTCVAYSIPFLAGSLTRTAFVGMACNHYTDKCLRQAHAVALAQQLLEAYSEQPGVTSPAAVPGDFGRTRELSHWSTLHLDAQHRPETIVGIALKPHVLAPMVLTLWGFIASLFVGTMGAFKSIWPLISSL